MNLNPTDFGLEELLTIPEAAAQLRVCDMTIVRWIKNGAMEAVALPKFGKKQQYRVKQSTLDAVLKAGAR